MKNILEDSDTALIVIDQQIDFQPGGALAVAEGDQIVGPIAELMNQSSLVVLTQDSHPKNHISFASAYSGKKPFETLTLEDLNRSDFKSTFPKATVENYLKLIPGNIQVLWPDHCVPGSEGWKFDSRLPLERASLILRKGRNPICDSYSAFRENDGTPTGLAGYLKERGIKKLVMVGLAGDYCVYWSILDALKEGFQVSFDPSLTRYVNFPPESREKSIADLRSKPQVEFVSF